MIKKFCAIFLMIFVVFLLIIFADIKESKIAVKHGNFEKKPLEIELGKYICYESKTAILELYNTAQAVLENGDTYFFNDIANAFIWFIRQKDQEKITLFVYSQDTNRYILAKNAWYSRIESTPMGYGFGAYEFHHHGYSDYYFDEILLCAARGETLLNPFINILLSKNKI